MRPFQPSGAFQPIDSGERLRRTAVRGAAASLAGQAAGFTLQMAAVVILARLLTPADFGIIAMVTTFNLLLRSFGLNGFTELIMQREEISETLASNLFWINLSIGVFLTVVFAGSGRLMALFFRDPAVAPAAVGMSLTIVLGSLAYIHLALLQRAMHFRTAAIINFVGLVFYVAVSVVCALAGLHYWALIWGSVAQSLVTAVSAWATCQWIPGWPRRVSGTSSGVKFAINVYLHFAFNYLTRNTDNLLVGYRFGAQVLGYYKRAYDLFVLAAAQLLSPISAVAVSTLSKVSGDREQFERYFLRAVSIMAFLGMGIGADSCLVGRDLIRVLLGPNWEEAGKIFTLFGPGIGVMLLYNMHGWIHLSIGRAERWFRWGLIEFVCTASLFVLMLPWGPSGIAFAWTASFFLLMFPGFWYAGKPIGLGIGPVFGATWKFFAASLVAGFASLLAVRASPYYGVPLGTSGAFVRMVSVSVVFIGLYLAAVIVLHRGSKPIRDSISLLHDLLPERGTNSLLPQEGDLDSTRPLREENISTATFAVAPGDTESKVRW